MTANPAALGKQGTEQWQWLPSRVANAKGQWFLSRFTKMVIMFSCTPKHVHNPLTYATDPKSRYCLMSRSHACYLCAAPCAPNVTRHQLSLQHPCFPLDMYSACH
ncbi:hypothetical protein O6P43_005124 [Quillaja saponaria]|uniref:Uncharacterized protein n=1 Tax=Quillaja saponaria TaxID=32244 RepID=A0AAD7Q5C2_QUISA|nr:hypothetical protein O6P43_005124 [Quillaja saponaria]